MNKIVAKLLVAFVFLMMSGLPYVGPVFFGLTFLWAAWALLLIVGLVRAVMAEGFTESEFQHRPD